MKLEEFKKLSEQFTSDMHRILDDKGHDYAGADDRFFNFRLCESFGLPTWKGIIVRLSDKFSRIMQAAKNDGELQVKDESLYDTCVDLANYALLLYGAYLDGKKGSCFEQYEMPPGYTLAFQNNPLPFFEAEKEEEYTEYVKRNSQP